ITKLGSVVKFIPEPVIVGFTSGIAITIFVGQWQNFFGLSVHIPLDASFYQKLTILTQALPHLNIVTTALGCLSILLVVMTPFVLKRIPGPLVAMVIAAILFVACHLKQVATLGSTFGSIPQHFPAFQLPTISFNEVLSLIGPAFTIALLGAIESLLSAAAADGMAGTRHNSNQELIGQGLANIFSPLFGGIAATGAIARTATNIRNGGTNPIAAIIHSVVLIAFILLLAPLARYIPLCALSAILFVVAYNIADFSYFFDMIRRAPRYDVVVLLTTFFLTIFTNLVIAVNIGVILAMLFFVRRMNQSVTIEQQHPSTLQDELKADHINLDELSRNLIIYNIDGPFFFGMTEKFEHALAVTHTEPKAIIFRLRDVPFMDISGIQTFHEIIKQFHRHGVKIYLCEANARVQKKLEKNDFFSWIEQKKMFNSIKEAINAMKLFVTSNNLIL
ncbi:MAG: SulP family inorganic anion transporter, partial [Gammaproteobacteria bacterium]